MFCGNCGAKVEDGAAFCPNCGSRMAQGPAGGMAGQPAQGSGSAAGGYPGGGYAGQPQQASASAAGYGKRVMSPDEKKYRTIGIVAVAVVVVAVLAIVISIWRANTGPNAVVNRFMQGILDGKWEKALEATDLQIVINEVDEDNIDVLWNYGWANSLDEDDVEEMKAKELREYINEEIVDDIEDSLEYLDYDEYDFKLKVKVLDSEKLAKYELRELEEYYLYDEMGIEFKDARRLTVELKLSGDVSEEYEEEFVVVKYGGKWYLSTQESGIFW